MRVGQWLGLPYRQICGQLSSHPPSTAQGPRTGRRLFGSLWSVHRRFERHVDLDPQQVFDPGHRVLLGERVPSNFQQSMSWPSTATGESARKRMDTRAAHTRGNGRRPFEAAMCAAVDENLSKVGVYQSVLAPGPRSKRGTRSTNSVNPPRAGGRYEVKV